MGDSSKNGDEMDQRNQSVAGPSADGKVTVEDDDELDDLDGNAAKSLLHSISLILLY